MVRIRETRSATKIVPLKNQFDVEELLFTNTGHSARGASARMANSMPQSRGIRTPCQPQLRSDLKAGSSKPCVRGNIGRFFRISDRRDCITMKSALRCSGRGVLLGTAIMATRKSRLDETPAGRPERPARCSLLQDHAGMCRTLQSLADHATCCRLSIRTMSGRDTTFRQSASCGT
jgi:hypothetical protein